MANAGAKLSSFPEVNDIQTGDMFPLLSGGDTNAKIDYATLARAIIAKLKSEDVVQAQTNNANKLISAALAYSMNQDILQLEEDTSTEQEEKSVTAELVTVNDADGGGADLTLNLEPHQSGSGDPSPENIRPISGWNSVKMTRAGKNVFPSKELTQTLNGITIHSNDDGSFTVNGTATATAQFDLTLNNELKLQPGQYTVGLLADKAVTFDTRHTWWFFYNLDAHADLATGPTSKTFTINAVTATRFYLRIVSGTIVDNVTLYPMLVYGSDAPTEFESYNGNTYNISLSSAGTVYGGTLDVVSGVLTVTHGYILLDGTQRFGLTNWRATENSIGWVYPYSLANHFIERTDKIVPDIKSDKLPTIAYSVAFAGSSIGISTVSSTTGKSDYGIAVRVADTSLTNETAINAYLAENPIQVVYKLATPQTYQLTPTEVTMLIGRNTIWMDADGKIKLDYKTNAIATKGDVNEAIARIKALAKITEAIAPVESSYKATQNYSVGDYLIVDYKLYKVTAAIANGGTITVGTNVTATTIMAEIKALA